MIKTSTISVAQLLGSTQLFSVVSEEDLLTVATRFSKVRSYKKGGLVFSLTSTEKCIGVILSGTATVKKENIVISTLKKGDIFGAVTLYNDEPFFVNNIIAGNDCSVVFISKEGVDHLISKSPRYAKNFIAYLSKRIYFLNTKIEGYTMPTADEKLYSFLSGAAVDGKLLLECKMTDLSNSLNLSRASLYRAFGELEESGRIKKDGKNIILL